MLEKMSYRFRITRACRVGADLPASPVPSTIVQACRHKLEQRRLAKMNINDLTIGQAKELSSIFSTSTKNDSSCDFAVGRYVIVRCRDAGVHAGVLVSKKGRS